ncbi:hypothetical protein GCM10017771_30860 [Streptomyces capitiformicae]|uniref:Uncharacterized protein n=1 Tax=Streptomyces capitiformicae TaxID=2014920 RepID=A0A919GNL9_9ACTN|nr:hypothetical protein GCM10017771_30860 [Streptomyces capitiformicae]
MATVQSLARSARADARFRQRVKERGGEVLEPSWLGSDKPHRARCAAGHECTPRPSWVQQGGHICRVCSGRDPQTAEAKFRARLADLGATLLEPKWLGNHKPHRMRCSAGHECAPRPAGVMQGQGICRRCVGCDPQAAWDAFRARVTGLGGEVLEPEWLGKDVPHRVRCSAGHASSPRPNNTRRWGICATCAGNVPEVAEAAFRARLKELGATLLEREWLGSDTPHRVRCRNGHDCTPRPHGVGQGQGICWACRGRRPNVFYVVADEINGVVKFGITSGDPRPRLGDHSRDGFDCVIRLVEGLPGDVALRLEKTILAALRDAREAPVRGREYFPARVLPLITDLVDGWTKTTPTPVSKPVQLSLNIAA